MRYRSRSLHVVLHAFICLIIFSSCTNRKNSSPVDETDLLYQNQKQLTEVIIYDVFSPPVASRIYAYTSLAAYEAGRFAEKGYPSITKQLQDFPTMPQPDEAKQYNYSLAATTAFFTVSHKVVFSIDSLKPYEESVYNKFRESLDEDVYDRSVAFGEAVGGKILERAANDNYKRTRGMRKYLGSKDDGKWQPTAPDYLDGTEPFWGMIKPFALDSSSQCKIVPPPPFSKDTNSYFYKNTREVYDIGNHLTDSQKVIIQYWDDNPFVMEHSGHMMFANKKITPGGHWMGIAAIACKKEKLSAVKTAQVYALTAIALIDGFITCWDEKYRHEIVRPITVIHNFIDEGWQPFLQTPPFPEYPSGHSTISNSAATVLTHIFGDNFSFHDDSDKEYIGMERDFTSFNQAAAEAAISRVYGGIHYRTGMEAGADQGKRVGNIIIQNIKLKESSASAAR
jgi:PAP2 superfamily